MTGQVFSGAKAVNAAVSTALGTRLPLRVYGLPGVRPVQERVYRWIATHRYRFRGVTPLCESAPGECAATRALTWLGYPDEAYPRRGLLVNVADIVDISADPAPSVPHSAEHHRRLSGDSRRRPDGQSGGAVPARRGL